MIKNIKRVGIIFLAVAIVCLMAIGCFDICAISDNNTVLLSNAKQDYVAQEDNNSNTNIQGKVTLPAGLTFRLGLDCTCEDGTPCICGNMATKWKEAITYSANHNANVNVILEKDWLAKDDETFVTSFGNDGSGQGYCEAFYSGRPAVTSDAIVSLDLNGHTIDRRLKSKDEEGNLTGDKATFQGNVILVYEGRLDLYDSSYDAEEVANIYEQYKDDRELLYNALKGLNFGKITGGACVTDSSGGGINVNHQGAYFYMHGGIITENWSKNAGAIDYCASTAGEISGGLIFDNTSQYRAAVGGTYAYSVSIKGGTLIAFNKTNGVSDNFGGGIYADGMGAMYISDVIVAYNDSVSRGGGITTANCQSVVVSNVIVANNSCGDYGGGIRIMGRSNLSLSGTNDIYGNTQRNSEKSDMYLVGIDAYCTINNPLKLKEDGSGQKIFVTYYAPEYNYFNPFTNGFTRYNKGVDPASLFDSEEGRIVLKNGEVFLDKSADSEYDYLYIDRSDRTRKYYNDNEVLHNYNDATLTDGVFVLGKILPNTSVNEFVKNILPFKFNSLKIYNCNGSQVYGDGADSKFANLFGDGNEFAIGTGWRIEYLKSNGNNETIYLSVLGDITGDGKVNSADVNYLRQVANNVTLYESFADKPYLQSAMLISNVKGLSVSDTEILWNVICGKSKINFYF